jgi:hypothetical protein
MKPVLEVTREKADEKGAAPAKQECEWQYLASPIV